MHRRSFLTKCGGLAAGGGVASAVGTGNAKPISTLDNAFQSNEGAIIHPPDDSDVVMRGFPPPPDNQVTLENQHRRHEHLRWAHQHMQEFLPTQRISRGNGPVSVFPRADRELSGVRFRDTSGSCTTIDEQLRRLETDAFLLVKDGAIVSEQYFHGMRPETPHDLHSAIKSIEATAIATLLMSGELDPESPIEKYIPELSKSGYAGAGVREIFDMKSGLAYPLSEFAKHLNATSPAARELGVPIGNYNYLPVLPKVREHGSSMQYKNSDPAVLVWAVEKQTGIRFADLLSERIWSKLGVERDAYGACDQLAHWSGRLSLTLRDFGRWGQMCLQDGALRDQQIVPASFFEDIRKNACTALNPELQLFFAGGTGYRSFFYHFAEHGNAIAASGAFGQLCYVNPKYDTVIVWYSTLGALSGGVEALTEEALQKFRKPYLEQWHTCHEISKALQNA